MTSYKILILGASYGSLLATKLAMAGHDVKLVCLPAEAEAINRDGAVVRLPVKGREPVEIRSKSAAGQGLGRRARRREPGRLRPRRPRHAGAAIPLARRARA